MSDLISRQAAIDALGDMPMSWADTDAELQAQEDWKQHREALFKLPTAEKKGKWIPHVVNEYQTWGSDCSECGGWYVVERRYLAQRYLYCPNCGARMEEG